MGEAAAETARGSFLVLIAAELNNRPAGSTAAAHPVRLMLIFANGLIRCPRRHESGWGPDDCFWLYRRAPGAGRDATVDTSGSSVVVVDEFGGLLPMERADTGGWGLPGGFMEPGEPFEDAARREVREEIGIEVVDLSLLGVFSVPSTTTAIPTATRSSTSRPRSWLEHRLTRPSALTLVRSCPSGSSTSSTCHRMSSSRSG